MSTLACGYFSHSQTFRQVINIKICISRRSWGKIFDFQFNGHILTFLIEVDQHCNPEHDGDANLVKIVYFVCAIKNIRKQNILKKQHIFSQRDINVAITSFTIWVITIVPHRAYITHEVINTGLSVNILHAGYKTPVQRGFFTNSVSDLPPTLGFLCGLYNFCNFVIICSLM